MFVLMDTKTWQYVSNDKTMLSALVKVFNNNADIHIDFEVYDNVSHNNYIIIYYIKFMVSILDPSSPRVML